SLRLELAGTGGTDAAFGVTNSGYNTGIAVREGAGYDFSVWARTDAPGGTPLTVRLTDAGGAALAEPLRLG
ncbi:hypothetical protein, partial [Actinoalloteichus caeruleus]|uniref:hypothetical protein n=1 Tax=Actinoalloteichus cyanogriseus TaxID=2893586 RepID=UPI0004AAC4EC